jgi:ribosomal protein L11 methyltransferase
MTYTEIKFTTNSAEQNEILIAQLAQIGFEGFEEEENILKAFIKQNEFSATAVDEIANNNKLSYTLLNIAQQNWNAAWESSFEPVVVNSFAAIRASFHKPVKNVQHEIIITPKMSFGTGHHATTYLMMEQMGQLNFAGKTVMDFGTGTGVLAILAEKMGATQIVAIDNDDWSIDNAKENISNNNCTHIVIQKGESIGANKKYDIILANINLNVIVQNMPLIGAACKPGTQILLSGFLNTDEAAIQSALNANELIFSAVTQKKEWLCVWALSKC